MSSASFNAQTFFPNQIMADERYHVCRTEPRLMSDQAHAEQAGAHGMAISLQSAEKRDPLFAQKAEAAILRQLEACGPTPGEFLVEIARAYAPCKDGRAFGAIFKSLAKRGLITCLRSDLPRTRGNGTSGGRLWARTATA